MSNNKKPGSTDGEWARKGKHQEKTDTNWTICEYGVVSMRVKIKRMIRIGGALHLAYSDATSGKCALHFSAIAFRPEPDIHSCLNLVLLNNQSVFPLHFVWGSEHIHDVSDLLHIPIIVTNNTEIAKKWNTKWVRMYHTGIKQTSYPWAVQFAQHTHKLIVLH